MHLGYTIKEMFAITINTILIVVLMTVYCQQSGTEATRKRGKAQVEHDAKIICETFVKDLTRAKRDSIDFVLIQEQPRIVKIAMQVVLDDEKKLVPVTYFLTGTTFSRVMRRKKKVLTQFLQNIYPSSNPNTGEFEFQVIVGMIDPKDIDVPQQTSMTDRARPLDEIPDDITVETEEGLEVDAVSSSSSEDENDVGRGMIDLYLKYSDYDVFALEKEKSNLGLELDRNKAGETETNDKLKTEVAGFEKESYNFMMPDVRDPAILADVLNVASVDPKYKEWVAKKRTLMAFQISLRLELRVIEDVLTMKKKTPAYEGKKIQGEN